MNKVTLLGTVASPPVYHCTEEARDVLRLTVETHVPVGQTRPARSHHHCQAWGPAAVQLHQHLHEGDQILLNGHLGYRKDGLPVVEIRHFTLLGGSPTYPKQR